MVESLTAPGAAIPWIDVSEPTEAELRELALAHGLPVTTVHDCLDSAHLPKFEHLGATDFFIFRHYDPESQGKPDMDTVQELTRKTAVFIGKECFITVHRKLPPFLPALRERFAKGELSHGFPASALVEIARCSVASYEAPIERAQEAIDTFELHIFNRVAETTVLEAMYFLKRKAAVYRRTLRQTLDILHRLPAETYSPRPWQSVRERGERLFIAADDEVEEIRHLLSTQISLASHRTNETMQVLTIFSAFFLPLTFIVGVYGMNFQHMPELGWRGGYPAVWVLMMATTLGIFFWFRRRGWLP